MNAAIIYVFIGGGLGCLLRYAFAIWFKQSSDIPWHTLAANLVSSLLLGLFLCLMDRMNMNQRAFLMIGFCGGFSTFSTFSLENYQLIKAGHYLKAFGYISSSVLICILAILVGHWLGTKFFK